VRKEKGKRIILLLQTATASNLPVSIMVKKICQSMLALLRTAMGEFVLDLSLDGSLAQLGPYCCYATPGF